MRPGRTTRSRSASSASNGSPVSGGCAGSAAATSPGDDPGQHRQRLDPLPVVRDPVDHEPAVPAELLGRHVRRRVHARTVTGVSGRGGPGTPAGRPASAPPAPAGPDRARAPPRPPIPPTPPPPDRAGHRLGCPRPAVPAHPQPYPAGGGRAGDRAAAGCRRDVRGRPGGGRQRRAGQLAAGRPDRPVRGHRGAQPEAVAGQHRADRDEAGADRGVGEQPLVAVAGQPGAGQVGPPPLPGAGRRGPGRAVEALPADDLESGADDHRAGPAGGQVPGQQLLDRGAGLRPARRQPRPVGAVGGPPDLRGDGLVRPDVRAGGEEGLRRRDQRVHADAALAAEDLAEQLDLAQRRAAGRPPQRRPDVAVHLAVRPALGDHQPAAAGDRGEAGPLAVRGHRDDRGLAPGAAVRGRPHRRAHRGRAAALLADRGPRRAVPAGGDRPHQRARRDREPAVGPLDRPAGGRRRGAR